MSAIVPPEVRSFLHLWYYNKTRTISNSEEIVIMTDDQYRILPVIKGRVQCLAEKKELIENCGFCTHSREFKVQGRFISSPALLYCTKCRITEKVDFTKAQAVKCADRQYEGFHSITNIIS